MPFPSSGDLSNPGIEPMSLALAGGFFTTAPLGNTTHERQILNSKTQGDEIKRMEKDIPCKEKPKVARAAILILDV